MASLFDDLHSSDSEDDDYVPDEYVSSDEENPLPFLSDNEIETKLKSHKSLDSGDKTKTLEETKADVKEKANDVYKSFLEEVEAEMNEKRSESGISSSMSTTPNSQVSPDLNSSKNFSSGATTPEKQSVELFDFAGETVKVTKDGNIFSTGDTESAVDKKPLGATHAVPIPPAAKRKGLQSVLGTILNKKQKITTLEKSAMDWRMFKKQEGITEELQRYNKGRGGYLERKRFLERSDLRSYEVERDMKFSRVKKT